MKGNLIAVLGVVILVALAAGPANAQRPGDFIPDQYIVVLQEWFPAPAFLAEYGLAPIFTYTVRNGFAAKIPPQLVGFIARDNRVAILERDRVVSAIQPEVRPQKMGAAPQPAQVLPTGVNRIDADEAHKNGRTGAGVKVAIIDTGIDTKHPDLSVNGGANFASGRPGNFNDGHGHGTHVAGIVAALNNAIGVLGVAPGAELYAVRVLDNSGFGTISGVIAGVDWAADHSMQVANLSLGAPGSSSSLCSAINGAIGKGVTVVVAAGNEDSDASGFTPANCVNAITVSAIADSDGLPGGLGPATSYGADDTFASFSNFGQIVDIAAPGVSILSAYKGGSYAYMSGTSMAAPHVSGAAALYIFSNPTASPGQVRDALVGNGWLQTAPQGFTGDPDTSHEPLVNAGRL